MMLLAVAPGVVTEYPLLGYPIVTMRPLGKVIDWILGLVPVVYVAVSVGHVCDNEHAAFGTQYSYALFIRMIVEM